MRRTDASIETVRVVLMGFWLLLGMRSSGVSAETRLGRTPRGQAALVNRPCAAQMQDRVSREDSLMPECFALIGELSGTIDALGGCPLIRRFHQSLRRGIFRYGNIETRNETTRSERYRITSSTLMR